MDPIDPFGDCRGSTGAQLPNLKGGHSTRADLRETALVVKPLVRDKVGRNKFGLRRLLEVRPVLCFGVVILTHEVQVVEWALKDCPALNPHL